MENYLFLLNTLLGFLVALFLDISKRDKDSRNSPRHFSLKFFLADNWLRLIVTLGLSLCVMLIIYLNAIDANNLFGTEWTLLNNLIYVVIGACPDLAISLAKRKSGFLQPLETKGYVRKDIGGELPPDDDEGH